MTARILEYREEVWLDLSGANGALEAIDPLDTPALEAWLMAQFGPGQIGAGGYGKDRRWYTRSALFRKGGTWRTVHLGIDLWAPAGAVVCAPRDGVIVSAVENAGLGNYGPTLIVKHGDVFALYGHLDRSALRWQAGDAVAEGASDPAPVVAAERAPGILAPGAFQVGGVQYAVAQFADGVYVGRPNLIAGAAFRPAIAGDTIVMYGIGFGAVTPAIAPGQITGAANALPSVVVRLGGVAAQTACAGLAGSFVGLYQFNVVIPAGLAGDVPLTVEVNGVPLTQQLMLTTGN